MSFKFSIISATLDSNWPIKLKKHLEAVNFQLEVIVKVNDISVKTIESFVGNVRFLELYGPDTGIYDALNTCLDCVTGDYYLVLGDDDFLNIGKLKYYIERYGDILSMVNPDVIRFYSRNLHTGELARYHSVSHLIKSSLHNKYGFYDTRFRIASDTFFLLKVKKDSIFFDFEYIVGDYGGSGISSTYFKTFFEHYKAIIYSKIANKF